MHFLITTTFHTNLETCARRFLKDLDIEEVCLQPAWYILNDIYHTDAPLLYPPHIIAAAAIFFAIGLKEDVAEAAAKQKLREWFAEINVDMMEITYITQDLLDLYQILGEYTDAHVPRIVAKLKGQMEPVSAVSTPAKTEVVTTPENTGSSVGT
ncbi:hypothetical protein HK097_008023 [Rhizophlyctis rosea]|uniref:Cyclin C-terminal domain-containing protein n=1 Tax=Rhizophlyctis rosea TaxID=64517 RepID=A0AAD5SAS9_9FUNG|nr:hypothetical protein HK097_008023 [Rhizophlyctis rosea]